MNKKYTTYVSVAALALMVAGVVGGADAQAFGQDGRRGNIAGPQSEWFQNLSESDQETLREARQLHRAGEHDEARELVEDAGIELPQEVLDRKASKMAVKEAIENNDYDAFVEATEDKSWADRVTEDVFETFVEAHELREDGDKEGARALIKELGLRKGNGEGNSERREFFNSLSESDQETLREARELRKSGDREGARALIENAGIELPERLGHGQR